MAAHITIRSGIKQQKQQQKVHQPVVQRARNVQLAAAILIPQQRTKAAKLATSVSLQHNST